MSHCGDIRVFQGCLWHSNTSAECCWSGQPLESPLSCSPKLFWEESSKDTCELRSRFTQGVVIFREEVGDVMGHHTPGWEQPLLALLWQTEACSCWCHGESSFPELAELCLGGAGFRERPCKCRNMSWGPTSQWPHAGRRNQEVSHCGTGSTTTAHGRRGGSTGC